MICGTRSVYLFYKHRSRERDTKAFAYLQIRAREVRVMHDHQQSSFDGCRANGIVNMLSDLNQTKWEWFVFDASSSRISLTFQILESCCSVIRLTRACRSEKWTWSPDTIQSDSCTFPDWLSTSPSIRSDWIYAEDRYTFESTRRDSWISPSIRKGKRHRRAMVNDLFDDRWSLSDVSLIVYSHDSSHSIDRDVRAREWIYGLGDNAHTEWHE